jgi:putative ABC transport system permease protein
MLEKLRFYLSHSINDLQVNGQRTLFALLCIASGVAAIVSLQTLGVMIEDTLTGSLQESNRGDMRIYPYQWEEEGDDTRDAEELRDEGQRRNVLAEEGPFGSVVITVPGSQPDTSPGAVQPDKPSGLEQFEMWLQDNYAGDFEMTYRQAVTSFVSGQSISTPGEAEQFVVPFIINADQYPYYGSIKAESGDTLDAMLQGPQDIVLSRNIADDLSVKPGDTVVISGAGDFTVRGIVPTAAESGLAGGFENFGSALLGFYYIELGAMERFSDITPGASAIYIKLENGPEGLEQLSDEFEDQFPYVSTLTTHDLEDQNSEISTSLNQLVIVMGLVSLLIGGIGIVNTMLVIVSRRTTEIAVLKTIGLEGEQVTVLFLVEAILMGIVGSLGGILLGWLGVYAIKGAAETFLGQDLTFHITLLPPLTGFIVGVIVTAIFGFIPTLAAGQVRPSLVLRPSDTVIPKAGRARSFVALMVVMLALSLVAQALVGDMLSSDTLRGIASGIGGLIGLLSALAMIADGVLVDWARHHTGLRILRWSLLLIGLPLLGSLYGSAIPALMILSATFIIVGILYVILWALIWLVGRFFPTWRFVDLKIALRSMLSAKGRAASTLLALVVGVFTLSVITMLTSAINQRFEELLENEVGGNVIIVAAAQRDTLDDMSARLESLEGVKEFAILENYEAELVSVSKKDGGTFSVDTLKDAAYRKGGDESLSGFNRAISGLDAREVGSNLPDVQFYAGRQLSRQDDSAPWESTASGNPPIVISANQGVIDSGLQVGDVVKYRIYQDGRESELKAFEIVGLVDRTGAQVSVGATALSYAPRGAFEDLPFSPNMVSAVVEIEEGQVGALRREMREVPNTFVLETKLLNDLVNQVIEQFTSFPVLVAALALVVGGIVIANSVALTTLERQREIGIMKAVGVQRERVLGMLLLEYGLMGFIGGLIGVGLGGIGLLLLLTQAFGGELGTSIPFLTAFELMGLCILIALAAALLTAWRASGEKPLNVLRYE